MTHQRSASGLFSFSAFVWSYIPCSQIVMYIFTSQYRSLPSSSHPGLRCLRSVSLLLPVPASPPTLLLSVTELLPCFSTNLGLSSVCVREQLVTHQLPSLPWKPRFQSSPTPNSGLHCAPNCLPPLSPAQRKLLTSDCHSPRASLYILSAPEWLLLCHSECPILWPLMTPPVAFCFFCAFIPMCTVSDGLAPVGPSSLTTLVPSWD